MRQINFGRILLTIILFIGLSARPAAATAKTDTIHYQKLFEWQTDIKRISSLAWSPDGQILAATGEDGMLQFWYSSDGHLLNTMRVYSGSLHSLDWSPNSSILATGGNDGTIRLWDPKSGREVCIFMGHGRTLIPGETNPLGVAVVKWSPNGRIIASSGYDGTVRLWDVITNTECNLLQPLIIPATLAYPVGGSIDWNLASDRLLSMGLPDVLPIWDAKTGERRDEISCPLPYSADNPCTFLSVDWSPNGQYILASGENGTAVFDRIWDVTTKKSRDLIQMCTSHFDWLPKRNALIGWCDGQLQIFNADTLQIEGTTNFAAGYWEHGQGHIFNTYVIAPDEQHIAIGSQSGDEMNAIIQMFGVSPNGGG